MKKALYVVAILVLAVAAFSVFVLHGASQETLHNKYRKIVIVDNSGNSGTLTDYQVFIEVAYDSNMQPDFDDLRFTWYNETSGEEVKIDYWLDKYVERDYAFVWAEIPYIRGHGQEVLCMYYGDPDATSGSNGEETFVFCDDFSSDTTPNYELWHGDTRNEFSWNPNGWLFVNASIPEGGGRNANLHVKHRTVQIDATDEKYWLETRGKAFGTGVLDYFGIGYAYKYDSKPNTDYSAFALVRDAPRFSGVHIESYWGSPWWQIGGFSEKESVLIGKDEWYRIGLGMSPAGTVFGRFYDDDYEEITNLVNQTVHQDNEWWVDLLASRHRNWTETPATLCVYFDYVRVRKFTYPEPKTSVRAPVVTATVNIDPNTLNLKSNGQWITAYITLPEGYNVKDIVAEIVKIDDIPLVWSEIQDSVFMAKFDRAAVQGLTNEPDYEEETKFYELTLTIRGELIDGTPFEGTDTIRVIMK